MTTEEAAKKSTRNYGLLRRAREDGDDEMKRGKLKSGRSGKKVTSRKRAIAIGLSEARKAGEKLPKKKSK